MNTKKGDFDTEGNNDEYEELFNILEKYTVELPDEYEIESVVDGLRQYVPHRRGSILRHMERLKLLISMALSEITLISGRYWAVSIALFLIGYIIASKGSGNPYVLIMLLSPLPFVLGLIEVFRGREEGMAEIEMACMLTSGEVMLSKLILISVYSILMNSVFSIMTMDIFAGISLLRIILLWMVPFTLVACISLFLVMKIKGSYTATISISAWAAAVLAVNSVDKISKFLLGLNIVVYILILLAGLTILIIQASRVLYSYSELERGVLIEFND